MDAARLMVKLAEGETQKNVDMLTLKKIYVMAGFLLEDYLQTQAKLTGSTRATVVANLVPEETALLDLVWHCAKAYHFMLLAQRQLRSGLIHSAVLTSLRLRDFDDVISVEDVYCMMALSSCADRSFGTCSKAFMKLESAEKIPEQRRISYEELAVKIFTQNEPHDMRADRTDCHMCDAMIPMSSTSCKNCGTYFAPCVGESFSEFNRMIQITFFLFQLRENPFFVQRMPGNAANVINALTLKKWSLANRVHFALRPPRAMKMESIQIE